MRTQKQQQEIVERALRLVKKPDSQQVSDTPVPESITTVSPGAKVIQLKSEAETWLDAMEVSEADRQAILEDASHWVLEDDAWRRTDKELMGPLSCKHCEDDKHARIVRRTWSPTGGGDWMCHACGKTVKP